MINRFCSRPQTIRQVHTTVECAYFSSIFKVAWNMSSLLDFLPFINTPFKFTTYSSRLSSCFQWTLFRFVHNLNQDRLNPQLFCLMLCMRVPCHCFIVFYNRTHTVWLKMVGINSMLLFWVNFPANNYKKGLSCGSWYYFNSITKIT